MKKIERCPVCGSKDTIEMYVYSEILRLPMGYSIRKCADCSLIRLSPIPNKEESNEHYKVSEYYSVDEYTIRAKKKVPVFAARLKFIENYIGKNRILDFGCAGGEFLEVAKGRGWDVFGVEPTEKLAQSATEKIGKNIFSSLDEAKSHNIKFDCVHSNHSFEHVRDPYKVAVSVSEVLNDGGVFVIEVPHQLTCWQDIIKSITYKILGKGICNKIYTVPVDPLHHTYFYSPKSLRNILNLTGFSIEYMRTINNASYKLPFPSLIRKISYYILDNMFSVIKKGPVIVCVARKL